MEHNGDEWGESTSGVMFDTALATWSYPSSQDVLDDLFLESLWVEEMFGEPALDVLAEDFCRSVLSPEEIAAYRAIAGGATVPAASVSHLPALTSPSTRRVA